jgi:choline-sulfatase
MPQPTTARPGVVLALALSLAAAGSAAASPPPPPGAAPAPAPAVPRVAPNVVLVTLDTTRADRLGIAGWPHARTPNLDALAHRGTWFPRCDSAAPITLPSHASILTGLFPPRHGVRDNGTFVLADRHQTLAETLGSAGWDTAAVVSAVVLARHHRLDQGFARYDDDLGAGYAAATQVGERDATATTDAALAVLAALRPPFFLWVHYFDPHEEYRPPTRFTDLGGPSRLYDGEIAYVDEQLGRLFRALPASTVVAVVGDHGEMLGDHGEATHGLLLFAGARRVPLVLAGPGVPVGAVDPCLARTVDLAPTLLHLAGLAAPAPPLDGQSLLPLAAPDTPACRRTAYSESFLPFFAYRWYPLRALGDGRHLFLQAPNPGLYELDPGATVARPGDEAVDLASGGLADSANAPGARAPTAATRAALAQWQERLRALLATAGEALEPALRSDNILSREQQATLASLGYLGGSGGAGQVDPTLPDPRAMTGVAIELHRLHTEVQQGRCRESLRPLDALLDRDPQNFPALNLAGYCLRQLGRTADAIPLFERASRVNEMSAIPAVNLAGAYREQGQTAAAVREYHRALALDPIQAEAASGLARLLREQGDRRAAREVLDRAHAAGARAPAVLLERGVVAAEQGDLVTALADFRDAARRDPANPVPLENAAHAAFALGQARLAAQLYEQTLRLAPGRGDLWKTLGAIYLEALAEPAAASQAFRRALAVEIDPRERAKLEAVLAELAP